MGKDRFDFSEIDAALPAAERMQEEDRVADALESVRATGYDGPCSVEVMDPNVLALPAGDAIRRAAETMKPLLARVER